MQVFSFIEKVERSASLYGYSKEMLSSLLLWFLPAQPNLSEVKDFSLVDHSEKPDQFLLESVKNVLMEIGFQVNYVRKFKSTELQLPMHLYFYFAVASTV